MGVATESFITIVGWAGFVAVLFLIYSLFTRIRRRPGTRGIFQRMPLLLPSVAFVISVFIILQMGIIPIQDYRGINSTQVFLFNEDTMRFRVYEPGIAYRNCVTMTIQRYLEPGESVDVNLKFYLQGNLTDTVQVGLVAEDNESMIQEQRIVSLNPGLYIAGVEIIYYNNGDVEENSNGVDVTLSQEMAPSLLPELLQWSTYQFMINVGCFFFLLGGICVGKQDLRERRTEEYDEKDSTSGEYRSYDI